jgi:tetratricopeptide (TPR) repeat protein
MRAVILVAIVLAAAPAHADDRAHAKRLYEQGLAHYNAAEYADAIAAWKQAYQIEPSPILLFNIGQAYRLSGDCAQARTYYDNYTHEVPDAPNRDELERARALCKSQPATVESPPPPPPPVVETRPPPPTVVETTRAIAIEPPSHTQRTVGIVVGAGGVALGIAAISFAVLSASDSNTLNHYSGVWTSTQAETQRQGQLDNALAYTFGAVGAAAAIAGGVLFVLDRSTGEHAVSVAPIRGGATFAWTRRF